MVIKENGLNESMGETYIQKNLRWDSERLSLWNCFQSLDFEAIGERTELENSNADDAVITQLAQGWVYCSLGGGKTEEASYIFQELIDKFDPTVKLLNNLAVCKVHMEQYPEAEEMLTTALEENPGDVDSLVNLIVVSRHLNKSQEVIDNLMEQLKQKDPNNLKLKEWLEAEAIFDENVGNFK